MKILIDHNIEGHAIKLWDTLVVTEWAALLSDVYPSSPKVTDLIARSRSGSGGFCYRSEPIRDRRLGQAGPPDHGSG